MNGLDVSLRLGLGLEGVIGESGDGLVYAALGMRADAASSNKFLPRSVLDDGGGILAAVPARTEYDVGEGALHPGSIGPIWRAMIRRAFDKGALSDLTADDLAQLLKGVSAHSTRVGLNQDLFASGEDLAGIMDALRWKSPRMPLAYNRNLAAEQGAAGRLIAKIG